MRQGSGGSSPETPTEDEPKGAAAVKKRMKHDEKDEALAQLIK